MTAGRDIFQIINKANLMFHPVQGLRAGLPPPFNNLEELDDPTTIDSRHVLYVITDGHAVEKVGMTSNIASRRLQYATKCAANPENPKYLVVICNLGLLPLDVDGKVEEVWDRLTHTLINDQNVPWVVKDLWRILRERDGERLFKRKIWLHLTAHLTEIGTQQFLITQPALSCEGEGFLAGGRQVERWQALVESVRGEIIDFLKTQPWLEKIKAAHPMMMQSWKPGRREFHEERNCDPPLPMSSQITVAESIVGEGEGNWVDSLPFAAKPNDPNATYSTGYTQEHKDGGIETIQKWILKMETGTFALLDTNHTLFGDGNGLSDFLQELGLIKRASYFDGGELVVWSSKSIVLLVVPPWCRCAYYHPEFQMALNVRVRCCLAAEVARQVCSFVRQKEPPEVTCSQHPGILAAYANALLIEGMHLTGHATLIVNCVVRDIFSPPSVNACVQNGLAKLGGTNQPGERGRHPVSLKAQYELRNAPNPDNSAPASAPSGPGRPPSTGIRSLPFEIQISALTYLRATDLSALQRCCRHFHHRSLINGVIRHTAERVYPPGLTDGYDTPAVGGSANTQTGSGRPDFLTYEMLHNMEMLVVARVLSRVPWTTNEGGWA